MTFLANLAAALGEPTPLSTAVLSLIAILPIACYLIWRASRPAPIRPPKIDGFRSRIARRLGRIDKHLVETGGRIIGTHQSGPTLRALRVFLSLVAVSGLSALLTPALGLTFAVGGFVTVLVIFRHRFRLVAAEDSEDALNPNDALAAQRSQLFFETLVACLFIPVFGGIAFAQIHQLGLGFELRPGAPSYSFVLFSIIELLKAGTLVDYYDLFSNQLPFERMTGIKHTGAWSKWPVLVYRIVLNVLMLSMIKNLYDSYARQKEDIKRIQTIIDHDEDPARRLAAIVTLERFAILGRGRALKALSDYARRKSKLERDKATAAEATASLYRVAQAVASADPNSATAIVKGLEPIGHDWYEAKMKIGRALRDHGDPSVAYSTFREIVIYHTRAGADLSQELPRVDFELGLTHRASAEKAESNATRKARYGDARDAFRSVCEKFKEAGSKVDHAIALVERAEMNVAFRKYGGNVTPPAKAEQAQAAEALEILNSNIEEVAGAERQRLLAYVSRARALLPTVPGSKP